MIHIDTFMREFFTFSTPPKDFSKTKIPKFPLLSIVFYVSLYAFRKMSKIDAL